MDTSKEFILMCEKAVEIQALAPDPVTQEEEIGCTSFFYLSIEDTVQILKWDNDEDHFIVGDYWDDDSNSVWLPRQDQLQEMVIHFGHKHQLSGICIGLSILADEQQLNGRSFEQLWLAFVMKELYSKRWLVDEKDWIIVN